MSGIKGKFRLEQDVAMDTYSAKMTAAHARVLRERGSGSLSEGIRLLAEEYALGFREKRHGPRDRRRKR